MTSSDLRTIQSRQGARFSDDSENDRSGIAVRNFGDAAAEYQAAKSDCVLFDLSGCTRIELTGSDRAAFLHNFCTNDIKRLYSGDGCEAFLTNIKGRVLAHIFVEARSDSLWLDSVAESESLILEHLDRYLIADDVELHARTKETGAVLVAGPESIDRLKLISTELSELPVNHHLVSSHQERIHVRRVDWVGENGFVLTAPVDQLPALWQSLSEDGVHPAGSDVFHMLRIEAGLPICGIDITDATIAQEVGRTERAISFTKGCYLGQEPIARIDALGHVNRELRGLQLAEEITVENGAKVFDAAGETEIGTVTSSASIRGVLSLAMGYLRSKSTAPGTSVQVQTQNGLIAARVFWPTLQSLL